jgi:hypothetical protein
MSNLSSFIRSVADLHHDRGPDEVTAFRQASDLTESWKVGKLDA